MLPSAQHKIKSKGAKYKKAEGGGEGITEAGKIKKAFREMGKTGADKMGKRKVQGGGTNVEG